MPGTKRARTHADVFTDLEDRAPLDLDPEDEQLNHDSDDDSAPEGETIDGVSARDHYEAVGKSKLRNPDGASLGPQYAGSRIARKGAADVDDEHDPFEEYGSGEESERSNDESEIEDDARNGHAVDIDDEDMNSADGSFSEDEEPDMEGDREPKDDRAELRKIMDEQSNVAAAISQATKVDAEKGRAVKRQRKTFDSLLNTRIRMQQSLIAVNSMQVQTPQDVLEPAQEAYMKAETAAITLWNTIESLRQTLAPPQSTTKPSVQTPKQLKITTTTPAQKIWTHMQSCEATALSNRTNTLTKWSRKTAAMAAPSQEQQRAGARRLAPAGDSASAPQQNITNILAEHLSSTKIPRLVERTRIPRACAPIQARAIATAPAPSPATEETANTAATPIYDDADFYTHLLHDLLASRQQDDLSRAPTAPLNGNDTLTTAYLAARAASKAKKANVDTKASKGRKMRYTVHEKLQNFMAPEGESGEGGRGRWGARQREELFGSLLGRRVAREEREVEGGDGGEEDETLMLFRS